MRRREITPESTVAVAVLAAWALRDCGSGASQAQAKETIAQAIDMA